MKKTIMAILIIVLMVSLAACGAGNKAYNLTAGDMDSGYADNRYQPAAAPAMAPEANDEYEYAMQETPSSMGGGNTVLDGRKLTFSASISLNTKQFDADYAKIFTIVEKAGGFVANENTIDNSASYGKPVGRTSYFTTRVPAKGFDSFLDTIAAIGEVTQKTRSSEDLTSQYFDTESRIELLEIRKERLMGYLLEAENAEDIVAFERELSDVLYDLDYYQGNKRQLDRLIEYATVDISLYEQITPETIGKDGEPLGERASNAFWLSYGGVGRFLDAFVVGLAAAVPVIILLIIIGAIVWVIVRVTRPLREKRRAKREAREERRREKLLQKQMKKAPYWQQPGYQPPPPPQPYQQPPQPEAPPKDE